MPHKEKEARDHTEAKRISHDEVNYNDDTENEQTKHNNSFSPINNKDNVKQSHNHTETEQKKKGYQFHNDSKRMSHKQENHNNDT